MYNIPDTFKTAESCYNPNRIKIPVTALDATDENAHLFNTIYRALLDEEKLPYLVSTPSGGISYTIKNFRGRGWDCRRTGSCIELTIIDKSQMCRIQFRTLGKDKAEENNAIYGRQAWTKFKKLCNKYGIDLDEYKIDNGAEVKETIPKYLVKAVHPTLAGITFDNCHHIDFHSSFPAGLINTHPEFKDVLTYCYEQRKKDPIFKSILNYSIGFMQSIGCTKAQWAHLAKDAIADNNNRVEALAKQLKENGRTIILYNTDGFWYRGDIWNGRGEGANIGDWCNDHTNCTLRFKSAGSYEYIEDRKYFPVVRGRTKLDHIKSRTDWQWGDIFNQDAEPIVYEFIEGLGITLKGELV